MNGLLMMEYWLSPVPTAAPTSMLEAFTTSWSTAGTVYSAASILRQGEVAESASIRTVLPPSCASVNQRKSSAPSRSNMAIVPVASAMNWRMSRYVLSTDLNGSAEKDREPFTMFVRAVELRCKPIVPTSDWMMFVMVRPPGQSRPFHHVSAIVSRRFIWSYPEALMIFTLRFTGMSK